MLTDLPIVYVGAQLPAYRSLLQNVQMFFGTFQIPVDSFNETPGGGRMVIKTSNRADSSPSTTNQRPNDEIYETT